MLWRSLRLKVIFAAFAASALVASAQTVTIPGLFTTGVTNANGLLGNNAQDSHYVVTANTGGNTQYNGNAYTVTSGALGGGWTANTGSARWIVAPKNGPGDGNDPTRPTGTYDYTLTFTMPAGAQLSTVAISGFGAVDNTAAIFVNGSLVSGQTLNTWTTPNSFTLNSANATFTSTTNTIMFRVNNSSSSSTGLLITSLSGTAVVPEVGAFLPIFGAIALVAGIRVARRRSAPV